DAKRRKQLHRRNPRRKHHDDRQDSRAPRAAIERKLSTRDQDERKQDYRERIRTPLKKHQSHDRARQSRVPEVLRALLRRREDPRHVHEREHADLTEYHPLEKPRTRSEREGRPKRRQRLHLKHPAQHVPAQPSNRHQDRQFELEPRERTKDQGEEKPWRRDVRFRISQKRHSPASPWIPQRQL